MRRRTPKEKFAILQKARKSAFGQCKKCGLPLHSEKEALIGLHAECLDK